MGRGIGDVGRRGGNADRRRAPFGPASIVLGLATMVVVGTADPTFAAAADVSAAVRAPASHLLAADAATEPTYGGLRPDVPWLVLATSVAAAVIVSMLIRRRVHRTDVGASVDATTLDPDAGRPTVLERLRAVPDMLRTDPGSTAWFGLVLAAIVLVVLALTFGRGWGWYTADDKFLNFWAPSEALSTNFLLWNAQRELGGSTVMLAPLTYAYLTILDGLGVAPWMIERLLHATYLAIAGTGAAVLCRWFLPRHRLAPLIAGLWFVVSPYAMVFLTPSGLFVYAAIAPWLFYFFLRGTTSGSPWRWAALFALFVAFPGSQNLPALVWAASPLVLFAGYIVWVRQSSVRAVLGWTVRAGVLVVAAFIPALARILRRSDLLGLNLSVSETALNVSRSSSWSETLRGLGSWHVYWNPQGVPVLPFATSFFTPAVLLATFVPVVVVFLVIALTTWRPRLLFGAVALVCAAVMVAAFPISDPSPLGAALLEVYARFPATFALRNTYKAGAGLIIATGVLMGYGVTRVRRGSPDNPWIRHGVVVGLAAVCIVASFPYWSGDFYASRHRTDEVPAYWTEAFTWLDAQPGNSRVMIVPSAFTAFYEWGTVPNGDIGSALINRPVILQEPLASGTPDSVNLIAELDRMLSQGAYTEGSLAPIARRMGLQYLLIRNDLDRSRSNTVPPSMLEGLRDDPDLERVATFGNPGENVGEAAEVDEDGQAGAALPPVEIYEIDGVSSETVRTVGAGPSTLISGDGAAWGPLANQGALDDTGPIQYTGRLDAEELTEQLDQGAALHITDTNRRRVARFITNTGQTESTDVTRNVSDLFGDPATQSVADYGDARSIEEVGGIRLVDPGPAHRPAMAFDDDPRSSWLTGLAVPFEDQGLHVVFEQPTPISEIDITVATGNGARRVVGAELQFPDAPSVALDLSQLTTHTEFAPRTVSELTLRITSVTGGSIAGFGFADVQIGELDLNENISLPTDVVDAAAGDEGLRADLAEVPLSYQFDRLRLARGDEETSLRRTFELGTARAFFGAGHLQATPSMTDEVLASLIGARTTAAGSERLGGRLDVSGSFAADGDPTTGWSADPTDQPFLEVRFPTVIPFGVEVTYDAAPRYAAIESLTVRSSVMENEVLVPVPAGCRSDSTSCPVTIEVPFLSTSPDVVVTPAFGPLENRPVRILEVSTWGNENSPLPTRLDAACRTDLATLDGDGLGLNVSGTTADLLSGTDLELATCGAVFLDAGEHDFVAPASSAFSQFRFVSKRPNTLESTPAPPLVTGQSAASIVATLEPRGAGTRLISGQADAPGWAATLDGASLGETTELDVQAGWTLPEGGAGEVAMTYEPQAQYTLSLWLAFVAVLVTLGIAIVAPRRSRPLQVRTLEGAARPWVPIVLDVAISAIAFTVGGPTALVVVVAAIVARRRRWVSPRGIACVAVVLIIATVIANVPPFGPALGYTPLFPGERVAANALARFAAIVLALALESFAIAYNVEDRADVHPSGGAVPARAGSGALRPAVATFLADTATRREPAEAIPAGGGTDAVDAREATVDPASSEDDQPHVGPLPVRPSTGQSLFDRERP